MNDFLKKPAVPVVVLIFASCLWGLSWLPLRELNALGFDGIFVVFVGQLVLSLLFFKSGFKLAYYQTHGRWLAGIFVFGGAAILCFTYAMIYGDVIRVMVLFYLLPVWGVLGGRLFLGERIDTVRWIGVMCALCGAYFILGADKMLASPPGWMDVLAFFSGLFFAINNLFFRGVEAVPLTTKLFTMFVGCTMIAMLAFVAGLESLPHVEHPQNVLWLLIYTLTWLLVANVFSQWAVTKMEAGRSSIIIIFELVAAVLSAVIIGKQGMSPLEIAGCVLVVAAALLEAVRVPRSIKSAGAIEV